MCNFPEPRHLWVQNQGAGRGQGSGSRDLFATGSERGGKAGAVSPGPGGSTWGPSLGDLSLQGCWTLMRALDWQQPAELLWELIWASGGITARLLLSLLGARSLGLFSANWSARGNSVPECRRSTWVHAGGVRFAGWPGDTSCVECHGCPGRGLPGSE